MSEYYSYLPIKNRFTIIRETLSDYAEKLRIYDGALKDIGNGKFRGNRLIVEITFDKYRNVRELNTFELFRGKFYEGIRSIEESTNNAWYSTVNTANSNSDTLCIARIVI